MKVLDPGHRYSLDDFDGDYPQTLQFMKRDGEGYPFNVGHYPGTNCQEVLRALIDRVKYLDRQIACNENQIILDQLRGALRLFEMRAAARHRAVLPVLPAEIEDVPTLQSNGHIASIGQPNQAQAGER